MSVFKKIGGALGDLGRAISDPIGDAVKSVGDAAKQFGEFVWETGSDIISTIWKSTPIYKAWSAWVESLTPEDQGFQVQRDFQSGASLPIVYGDEVKVKGVVVAKEVSSDYKFLHVFYVMSVEGAEVTEIYIDGQAGNDAQWVYKPASNSYNTATRFNNKVTFKVANTSGGLGSTPTDLGCTLYNASIDLFDKMVVIYARYSYDREVYQGEPQIYALMRSTDTTLSNPANALKHYLTVSDYGAKIPSAKIDDASFTDAAALCDELVTIPATGGTRKRYTINTLLDTKNEISKNIGIIRFATDSDLTFVDGKYSLKLKGQGDAVATFDDNVIIGDVSFSSQDDAEQFNVVVVNFTDKNLNYKTNAVIYKSSDITYPFAGYPSDFKAIRDDGVEKEKRITLNGVTGFYEAQAFAEKMLKRSLFSRVCQVTTSWKTAEASVGDIVGLTVEEFGFANKEFRVLEKQVGLEGTITWKLMEHEDSVYSITYDNAEPSAGTITYPNPWERLAAPTGLSITEIDDGKAQLNFTPLTSDLVDTYVVEVVNQDNASQVFRFFGNSSPIYFEVDTVGTFDVSIYAVSDLQINGVNSSALTWSSAGFAKDWEQVTGTGKPEDYATNSKVYYQDTPPSNPLINDVWVDTSVTPNVTKVRGEFNLNWVVAANLVDDTSQLTDGAGLGATADWDGVSGTGKPEDYADNTTIVMTTGAQNIINEKFSVINDLNILNDCTVISGTWNIDNVNFATGLASFHCTSSGVSQLLFDNANGDYTVMIDKTKTYIVSMFVNTDAQYTNIAAALIYHIYNGNRYNFPSFSVTSGGDFVRFSTEVTGFTGIDPNNPTSNIIPVSFGLYLAQPTGSQTRIDGVMIEEKKGNNSHPSPLSIAEEGYLVKNFTAEILKANAEMQLKPTIGVTGMPGWASPKGTLATTNDANGNVELYLNRTGLANGWVKIV